MISSNQIRFLFAALLIGAAPVLTLPALSPSFNADAVAQQFDKVESPEVNEFSERILPFVNNHCLDCHTGDGAEGGVDLSRFETEADAIEDLEVWSKVLKAVQRNEMPPPDESQPERAVKTSVQNSILELMAHSKHNGPPLGKLRRLNRVEYENTIRDLFRLSRDCFSNSSRIVQTTDYFQPASGKMPRSVYAVSYLFNLHRRHSDLPGVSSLTVDPPVEHGFSNDQDALALSPLLLERHFELAKSILDNPEFAQISGLWEPMFVAEDSSDQSEQIARAHRQIENFLPRAFRRDVSERELNLYRELFDKEFKSDDSYTQAMKTTVSAMLVSPSFLYRQEFLPLDPEGRSKLDMERARNYAMASRLSYFLWGTMPDDLLFQAAQEGRLLSESDLEVQVSRMMKDVRVKSLATNFGMEWLKVLKAASSAPDRSLFPEFYKGRARYPSPSVAMMIEQLLLFETIMIEDRSILEFIDADFAYLNRQLMDWYNVDMKRSLGYSPPNDLFEDFYRIKWEDANRGGVITAGATLLSTSTTTRTSPVFRGAWIMDVVFNSPPPPAPADVPPLESQNDGKAHKEMNVRAKLELHRKDPACASCHARIDPPGFALESFDAVGRWRQQYDTGDPIDASGEIDGSHFESPAQFKEAVVREKSRFIKAFVEHTTKYALGRQLHYSDELEIRRVAAAVAQEDNRFQSVIKHVVLSEMFQNFDELQPVQESDFVTDANKEGVPRSTKQTDPTIAAPTIQR